MRAFVVLTALVIASGVTLPGASSASEPVIARVSVSTAGVQGGLDSLQAAINGDGRYVAFASDAANLVANDTNSRDIFLHDRLLGTTVLVSSIAGTPANRPAVAPAVSGEGLQIAFQTDAGNLMPEDAVIESDIFVRDLAENTISRVSVASDSTPGNDDSESPSISGDGRFVAYTSLADNLVPDDDNMDRDVFVRDRLMGTTELVSVATGGAHGNFASGGLGAGPARLSADGRFVVFGSFANNLVADDANSSDDAFLHDRQTGVTERVSVSSEGNEGSGHSFYPSVSDDGRFVVFYSDADDLTEDDGNGVTDVFLRDRQLGTTTRLSRGMGGAQPDGPSRFPDISADGRYVAFESGASNLVPGDSSTVDIFLFDREGGDIEKLTDGDAASTRPAINAAGAVVAFQSLAADLVPGDSNMRSDVFVWGKALAPPVAPGDADCNGTVNSIDGALILQHAAGLFEQLPCPGAADVSTDGAINAIDAALVLQFVAGLLEDL